MRNSLKKSLNDSDFVYYEPNPDTSGLRIHRDCTIRAICAATGLTWRQSFDELIRTALERYTIPNEPYTFRATIRRLGFKNVTNEYDAIKNFKEYKEEHGNYYRLMDFVSEKNEGIYIVLLYGHVLCVKDGVVYDKRNEFANAVIEKIYKLKE